MNKLKKKKIFHVPAEDITAGGCRLLPVETVTQMYDSSFRHCGV